MKLAEMQGKSESEFLATNSSVEITTWMAELKIRSDEIDRQRKRQEMKKAVKEKTAPRMGQGVKKNVNGNVKKE